MATKGPGVSFLTEVTIYARGMHKPGRKALRYHIRVARVGTLAVEGPVSVSRSKFLRRQAVEPLPDLRGDIQSRIRDVLAL